MKIAAMKCFALATAFALTACASTTSTPTVNEASDQQVEASNVAAEASVEESTAEQSSAEEQANVEESTPAATESDAANSSLFIKLEWPVDDVTANVPVPEFSVKPTSVETTNRIDFIEYENVDASEVEAYIEILKSAGFTHSANENKSTDSFMYSGYDSDDPTNATNVSVHYRSNGKLSFTITNTGL